jgi:hypothetical protein
MVDLILRVLSTRPMTVQLKTGLTFDSFFVSTAALVDRKMRGYVAVIATIPPVAPATACIAESLMVFCYPDRVEAQRRY